MSSEDHCSLKISTLPHTCNFSLARKGKQVSSCLKADFDNNVGKLGHRPISTLQICLYGVIDAPNGHSTSFWVRSSALLRAFVLLHCSRAVPRPANPSQFLCNASLAIFFASVPIFGIFGLLYIACWASLSPKESDNCILLVLHSEKPFQMQIYRHSLLIMASVCLQKKFSGWNALAMELKGSISRFFGIASSAPALFLRETDEEMHVV